MSPVFQSDAFDGVGILRIGVGSEFENEATLHPPFPSAYPEDGRLPWLSWRHHESPRLCHRTDRGLKESAVVAFCGFCGFGIVIARRDARQKRKSSGKRSGYHRCSF